MRDLLERAGVAKDILDHVGQVIPRKCKRCMQFAHAQHRPKVKSWFGKHFNHVVQADLFFLWDCCFIILIDECTRYKFADEIPGRSYEAILECLQKGWFRYFGPPRAFLCDQEGALAGDAFAQVCDKYQIDRWLAGSDPGHLGRGGKHTTTGLAEKHIDLLKLSMLKMHVDLLEQGLVATPAEIVAECMMASNMILSVSYTHLPLPTILLV